jgi:N-acetylmuramoyl-L-alanine amidase
MASPLAGRPRVDSRKRAILRAAVAENLATIEGRTPRRQRPRPRRAWLWLTPVTAVTLLVLAGGPRFTAAGSGRLESGRGVAGGDLLAGGRSASPPGRWLNAPHAVEPATFQLAVRRIVVDPGHGGADPGASSGDLREKDLTLDIALRLRAALTAGGFEVVMTRGTDETMSLQQRVRKANEARGDLFLSIHVNSIPAPDRRGVETYVAGTTSDPRVAELSGAENSGSGYSLADFRTLLEGVLLDVRHRESRRLGEAVQNTMFAELRRSNRELEDRGVKQAPFVVLIGAEMPGVLAEVSCLSNPDDIALLRDATYRQTIAEALTTGVRAFAASCDGPTAVPGGRLGGM